MRRGTRLDKRRIEQLAKGKAVAPIKRCALLVESEAKRVLSVGGGSGKSPSAVGSPPHTQTGTLRNSVTHAITTDDKGNPKALVGATEKYAKIQERGTVGRGGRYPDIVPVRKKYLTVPIDPAAKGKRAAQFDMIVVRSKTGGLILARVLPGGGLRPMFALRRRVAIPARPFMGPALRSMAPRFPSFFKGSMT